MSAKVYLAERIKDARVLARMTQDDVARALGVLRPSVSAIEAGERDVKALELAKLGRLFSRPLSWFLPEDLR